MRQIISAMAALMLLTGSVLAQPAGGGPGWGSGMMMGPGMWGSGSWGHGMMGRGGFGQMMCGPGGAGFAEWRIDRLQQALKLTDAQRAKFEEFKTASANAASAMHASCPKEFPASMAERMALMESRMEIMLTGIKTVRPAFDAFYATLSDEQKAKLNQNRGRFGRWRDRW